MYKKVRPFVPDEFKDDELYAAPTATEAAKSKDTKRARSKRRAHMALEAKQNQDSRATAQTFMEQLQEAVCDSDNMQLQRSEPKTTGTLKRRKARKET